MNQSNWKMQWKQWIGVALAFAALLAFMPALHAQTTATLSGTVTDASGAVIPGAQVTVTDESNGSARQVVSDGAGFFSFPALNPGSYSVKADAKGFTAKKITGIVLHAGDERGIASIALAVGAATQTVTVQAAAQIIPVENGAHGAVLDYRDIQNLTMFGQDTTELLKVLPGVTSVPASNGSNDLANGPPFDDEYIHINNSFVGEGLISSGAPYRGGTLQLEDGVDIDDPGCDCASISIVLPEFTQEVNVQTTNYGADAQYGPVVINTTSRSGGSQYHGTGFFYAGNDALNAWDWQTKHQNALIAQHNALPTTQFPEPLLPKGGAHRYYPGADAGGPIPYTHKKLFGWFGYEGLFQNEGNANILTSYIPTPEMMGGDFTSDNQDNQILCSGGFNNKTAQNTYCDDLTGTILPDGTTVTNGIIPAKFLNPDTKILSSFWPAANSDPRSTPGNYNYYQPIINIDNGWVIRARADYNISDKSKLFISYQQGHDSTLAQGNGAHIYWTPGNSIPFPGGGITEQNYSKTVAGHFVHVFNATTTNELIASWGYGSFPFTRPDPAASSRAGLNYNEPTIFNAGSTMIPSYSGGPGYTPSQTMPDFEQSDFFFNGGQYHVYKEMPAFTDNFTKVFGAHTIKVGAFTENVANGQDAFGVENGKFQGFVNYGNLFKNLATGTTMGSPDNPTADFLLGSSSSYTETNKGPLQDMAYQDTSFFVDDSWKVNSRLSMEIGTRFDHVGHWYDRTGNGVAVFYPGRVLSDWYAGKPDPGVYWRGISGGLPNSGMPNRLAFLTPRFGFSWDTMGNGKTVVRGGWGAYRYSDQNNDAQGPLQTAQGIQTYNLPGQTMILPNQLGLHVVQQTVPQPKPQAAAGGVTAFSPTDYGIPLTYSYNLTVDRQLPWNTLLEVAYVGNSSSQLVMGGEGLESSNFNNFINQNKTPLGAFFLPDPVTNVVSTNPENISQDKNTGLNNGNNVSDYHPFGLEYGTNQILMETSIGYQNYNGLQVSWEKRAGRLSYNLNATWSKTLGTTQQRDPFILHNNYGPTASDRPIVFNSSYIYSIGNVYHGSQVVQQILNGWQISGTSTWQQGGYVPTLLGAGIPNFGLSLQYQNIPANLAANGVQSALSANSYYGTDAGMVIMPILTCNPNSGRATNQLVNLSCFTAPALYTNGTPGGAQGGQKYPYMHGEAYFDNDLALFKTFPIRNAMNVQFRAEVFNWVNHALMSFTGANPVNQYYFEDYTTHAITLNQGAVGSGATYPNSAYAVPDTKVGYPYERTVMLVAKFNF